MKRHERMTAYIFAPHTDSTQIEIVPAVFTGVYDFSELTFFDFKLESASLGAKHVGGHGKVCGMTAALTLKNNSGHRCFLSAIF